MAVLSVLGVLVLGIITSTTRTIGNSTIRLNTIQEGRFGFDRLSEDISRSARSSLQPIRVTQAAGNDDLAFYAFVSGLNSGAETSRGISFVSYSTDAAFRSSSDLQGPQLFRAVQNLVWAPTSPAEPELLLQTGIFPTIDASNYQSLSQGVFRFEVSFIARDTGLPVVTHDASLSGADALVITIAAMDPNLRILVPEAAWPDLVKAFADAVDGSFPIATWIGVLDNGPLPAVVPQRVKQGIKVYQRILPLNRLP